MEEILKELAYKPYNWLPSEEYLSLLASAKVNLACSWAETFNYNVAEAATLGTPSVISSTIPLPGVIVREVNNPVHIANGIRDCVERAYERSIRGAMGATAKFNNHECRRILSDRLPLVRLP